MVCSWTSLTHARGICRAPRSDLSQLKTGIVVARGRAWLMVTERLRPRMRLMKPRLAPLPLPGGPLSQMISRGMRMRCMQPSASAMAARCARFGPELCAQQADTSCYGTPEQDEALIWENHCCMRQDELPGWGNNERADQHRERKAAPSWGAPSPTDL